VGLEIPLLEAYFLTGEPIYLSYTSLLLTNAFLICSSISKG